MRTEMSDWVNRDGSRWRMQGPGTSFGEMMKNSVGSQTESSNEAEKKPSLLKPIWMSCHGTKSCYCQGYLVAVGVYVNYIWKHRLDNP